MSKVKWKGCTNCNSSAKPSCTYCHIVPQVYQKKWSTNNNSNVIYFNKGLTVINNNGGNVSKHMGEWDYYLLNNDLMSRYNLDIKAVEQYFSNTIENKWNDVYKLLQGSDCDDSNSILKHFNNKVKRTLTLENKVSGIREEDLEDDKHIFKGLKKFVILQYLRNYYNYFYTLKKQEGDISNFSEYQLKNKWLEELIDCLKDDNDDNSILSKVLEGFKKFSLVVIFASEKKFILSDNPAIFNRFGDVDNNISDGYYLAISPEILICYFDSQNWRRDNLGIKVNDVFLTQGTDIFIKYFNRLLVNRALTTVGFNSKEITNHVLDEEKFKKGNSGFNDMLGINSK